MNNATPMFPRCLKCGKDCPHADPSLTECYECRMIRMWDAKPTDPKTEAEKPKAPAAPSVVVGRPVAPGQRVRRYNSAKTYILFTVDYVQDDGFAAGMYRPTKQHVVNPNVQPYWCHEDGTPIVLPCQYARKS